MTKCEGQCQGQGPDDVQDRPSMTCYYWDREKTAVDPNRVGALCSECWGEYESYWKERWRDYNDDIYAGIMEGEAQIAQQRADDRAEAQWASMQAEAEEIELEREIEERRRDREGW